MVPEAIAPLWPMWRLILAEPQQATLWQCKTVYDLADCVALNEALDFKDAIREWQSAQATPASEG